VSAPTGTLMLQSLKVHCAISEKQTRPSLHCSQNALPCKIPQSKIILCDNKAKCLQASLILAWVLKLLPDHNPFSRDIPVFFSNLQLARFLLPHHEWTRPLLLIGYKCVVLLSLIRFQHFSEITYCTFKQGILLAF